MSYIYAYLNPLKPCDIKIDSFNFLFEPFYIGKGTGERMLKHLSYKHCDKNKHKSNTINKIINAGYNIKNYIIKLIDDIDEQKAFALEIHLIKSLRDAGINLTNKTNGGEGILGYKHTNETKRLLSSMFSGIHNPAFNRNFKYSEESKLKMKRSQIERSLKASYIPPMLNKKHTDYWKITHSKQMKLYYETRDNFNKNKTYNELYGDDFANKLKVEQSNRMKKDNPMNDSNNRNKVSLALKGINNPMNKYKYKITFDGISEITYSLQDFAYKHGLTSIGLRAACKNKRLYKNKYFVEQEIK